MVTADDMTTECLVIDPGITGAEAVEGALRARGLAPTAILATHGHVDHVGDAHAIASRWDIPLYLADEDQHLLTRPGAALGPEGDALVREIAGSATLPGVAEVHGWDGPLRLASLDITPFHAPGHTPGSTLLRLSSKELTVTFTGDVVFAGTIGRVDLPGGSMTQMRETLRRIVEHVPAEMALLPGHGEPTSLRREISTNPYLQPDP